MPVFATSHVYAGSDDAGANRDLDGVEFCDAPWLFDAQPGLPSHANIAALLPAASGSAARLFAFGMDAWNLVPYLDWLRAHPGSYLPGASGQLTADQFGRVRRVLIWAKFQNGLARPLGGSLQMDDMPSSAPPTRDRPGRRPVVSRPTGQPARHGLMRAAGDEFEQRACVELERAGLSCWRATTPPATASWTWSCATATPSSSSKCAIARAPATATPPPRSPHSKQDKLIRAAQQWLAAHPQHAQRACRFDVVSYDGPVDAVRREWLRGAFEAG